MNLIKNIARYLLIVLLVLLYPIFMFKYAISMELIRR